MSYPPSEWVDSVPHMRMKFVMWRGQTIETGRIVEHLCDVLKVFPRVGTGEVDHPVLRIRGVARIVGRLSQRSLRSGCRKSISCSGRVHAGDTQQYQTENSRNPGCCMPLLHSTRTPADPDSASPCSVTISHVAARTDGCPQDFARIIARDHETT